MNRILLLAVLGLIPLIAGCVSGDCLPEPTSDATPPDIRILVHYTPPGGRTETSRTITASDSSITLTASRSHSLRVLFTASDSSGMRRLAPAVTVQQTVGIGVERAFAPIDAVTSSCPVSTLREEYEAHTSGKPRVLIVSALAENWVGARSSIEPASIRME